LEFLIAVRRRWLLTIGLLAALLVGAEFLLPPLLEKRVESRLTADGGTAKVSLAALPAERLLFAHGDRIDVDGRDIELKLSNRKSSVLKKLDGFDEVDVRLSAVRAGPFTARTVLLTRPHSSTAYRLRVTAATSPTQIGAFAGGALGGLLEGFAGGAAPRSGDGPQIQFDVAFKSDGGRVRLVSGNGDLAGLRLAPVAAAFARAIGARLY
jgi:hypothetical protein